MEEFRAIETISQGKFDLRQKVIRVSDRRLFEWREINYKSMDDALKEMFIFEINSLKKLRHPNIIQHEDVILKRDQFFLYLITECCGDSSLQTLIDHYQMKREFIQEDLVWTILYQLAEGLHALSQTHDLYKSQIFHRCLKPSSVYFHRETKKIKIGDFGLGLISKPYYMCPELEKFGLCNEKSDIWSMGCIVYELCALIRPFREVRQDESGISDWKLGDIPKIYTRDLVSILKFILTPDEDTRPSAAMILHHPILKSKKVNTTPAATSTGPVLETDFPLNCSEDQTLTEDSFNVTVVNGSELSLNRYLSMMSDQNDCSVFTDIHSFENGTAYPKATSSVLYSSPSPIEMVSDSCHQNLESRSTSRSSHRSTESSDNSLQLSQRTEELLRLEANLQRWAGMLEEKEQELAHKEKRLQMWEVQLMDMEKLSLGPIEKPTQSSNSNRRKSLPRRYTANESSGVETDMESTTSTYPEDSYLQPTAVRLEPTKIRNPFSNYQIERHVQFHIDDQPVDAISSKQFTEQRLHWLEMKKRKHLGIAQPTVMKDKSETDYVVMEEKSIATLISRRRMTRSPPFRARPAPSQVVLKENLKEIPPPQPSYNLTNTKSGTGDSKVLSNQLRAKLKSHNLPGLR